MINDARASICCRDDVDVESSGVILFAVRTVELKLAFLFVVFEVIVIMMSTRSDENDPLVDYEALDESSIRPMEVDTRAVSAREGVVAPELQSGPVDVGAFVDALQHSSAGVGEKTRHDTAGVVSSRAPAEVVVDHDLRPKVDGRCVDMGDYVDAVMGRHCKDIDMPRSSGSSQDGGAGGREKGATASVGGAEVRAGASNENARAVASAPAREGPAVVDTRVLRSDSALPASSGDAMVLTCSQARQQAEENVSHERSPSLEDRRPESSEEVPAAQPTGTGSPVEASEEGTEVPLPGSSEADGDREMSDGDDSRRERPTIGGRSYPSPVAMDDLLSDDFRSLVLHPWFRRHAVIADAANEYLHLEMYAWDGDFHWGVTTEALRSRAWRDAIAFDQADLASSRDPGDKARRHVRDAYRGIMSMPNAPVIDDGQDVDLWRYRTFRERHYVAGLCSLTPEMLEHWRGRYDVDPEAICWDRPFVKVDFRYVDRSATVYWATQLPWERRALSVLGRFVPFHLQCCYNLTEGARDRIFPRIPGGWGRLATAQGFLFEQEPVFSYKARALIEDPTSGLWVVAVTERVVRVCAAVLMAAYAEYRLWWVPADIIMFARRLELDMAVPLGSYANVREVLEMLRVIETTRFEALPSTWRSRANRATDHHPGRTGIGGDFVYYDPHERRKIDENTARSRASAARVMPGDQPRDWDYDPDEVGQERTPRDSSRDYDPSAHGPVAAYVPPAPVASAGAHGGVVGTPAADASGGQGVAVNASSDDAAVIRRFLVEAGVIAENSDINTIGEMRGYLRGRLA